MTEHPLDDLDAAEFEALAGGTIGVVGQLTEASNGVMLVTVDSLASPYAPDGTPPQEQVGYAVYKPVRAERALWDFPDGTLAGREVASCLIDRAGGWGIVPATVLREGPVGVGSLQRWVGPPPKGLPLQPGQEPVRRSPGPPDAQVVAILPVDGVHAGWHPVLEAQLRDGTDVFVAHADDPALASVAVLDAVLNNTDRKGSHLLRDDAGRLWGIDHGVSLHAQDKLRTILWGWQDEEIPQGERARLDRLAAHLDDPDGLPRDLVPHLTEGEIEALRRRVSRLRRTGVFPGPAPDWHAIPWPPI